MRVSSRSLPLLASVAVVLLCLASCVGQARPAGSDVRPAERASPALPAVSDAPVPAQTAVLTEKGDDARTGWDSHETVLDHGSVRAARFGKRLTYAVDGQVYAQPLFVPNLMISGLRRNVVIVATEHDSVFAFDADATGAGLPPLWQASFLGPGVAPLSSRNDLSCPALEPTVGITSTPVLDAGTMTLYVVAATRERSGAVYRIHALDVTTGRDRVRPAAIQGSVAGTGLGSVGGRMVFTAIREQQRMGLLLTGGVVYAGFASYCDRSPSSGWIMGFAASDLRQVVVYNDTPNGFGGGLWESGTGLAADDSGHLYLASGNGSFDLDRGGPDAGDALLELVPANGTLGIVDYFEPFNQSCLNHHDQELGAGGPLLIQALGEVIAIGKEGRVYVTRLGHLGGYHTIPQPCDSTAQGRTDVDQILQELPPDTVNGGVWGSESYWSGAGGDMVYTAGVADHLKAWRLVEGRVVAPFASQALESLVYPGGVPVVSSNGGAPDTAIVWMLDQAKGPALRAYDATDLGRELYSSQEVPARDAVGSYVKFSVPTVAGGRVFVGTRNALLVYGLLG